MRIGQPGGITIEMMIHFSGVKHFANPGVLVFPTLLVCLDCGVSRFTVAGLDTAAGMGIAVV